MDLNEASLNQLMRISGIGRILSRRIVHERQERRFTTWAEVGKVVQIGEKRLENLRKAFVLAADPDTEADDPKATDPDPKAADPKAADPKAGTVPTVADPKAATKKLDPQQKRP